MRRLLRLSVCAALLAVVLVPAATGRSTSLAQQLAAALHSKKVNPAKTGAVVYDLQTGSVVYALHAERAAPSRLEREARDDVRGARRARAVVPDRDGRARRRDAERHDVAGDVVLKGYGDPTLSRAELWSLAHQVARDGITHVKGRVIGDESWFDTRRVGRRLEAQVLSPRVAGALGAHRRPRLGRARGDAARALCGAALSPLPRRRRRVGARAGADRRRARRRHGARLRRLAARRLPRPLHGHVERQLHGRDAPEAGRRGAARRGDRGRRRRGDARAPYAAAGVSLQGIRIVDGSGLSRIDRWTAAGLANVLRQMWLDPDLRRYITASLPVAGVSGTLRLPDAEQPRVRLRPREDGHDRQLRRRCRASSATATSSPSSRTGTRSSSRPRMRTQDAFAEVLARAAKSGP